jgi:photosystem II stability/assembly factor-like uncharacterized protein
MRQLIRNLESQPMSNTIKNFRMMTAFCLFSILLFGMTEWNSVLHAQDFWGEIKAPYASEVHCFAVSSNNTIWAGTWGDGVYYSNTDGSTWSNFNSGLTNLHINKLTLTSGNELYAGTEGGGVFFLGNSSNSWTAKNSGLENLNVRALTIKSDGTIFAGTYGGGVYSSTDGGDNWIAMNKGLYFMDIRELMFSKNESSIIAATYGGGVFRSTTNGKSWTKANTGLKTLYISDLKMNGAGEIFASTDGQGVMQSIDHGMTWRDIDTTLKDLFVTCIALNKDAQVVAGSRSYGVYRFDDILYKTWQKSDLQSVGVISMIGCPNGNFFASVPFDGVYVSKDGGRTWVQTGFKYTDGLSLLRVNPYNGDIYVFNGKDIYRTTDKGNHWTANGLDTLIIIDIAFSPNNNVYALSKGKGLFVKSPSSSDWTFIAYKDTIGNSLAINSKGDVFIGVTKSSKNPAPQPPTLHTYLCRTTDGGATWTETKPYDSSSITVIAIKSNTEIYLTKGKGIMKSVDNGSTWNPINGASSISNINSIKFNSKGHIFLGTNTGVQKSTDDGVTWSLYDFGFPESKINPITISTSNAIFAGSASGLGVYITSNNGTSWDSLNTSFVVHNIKSMDSYTDGFTYMTTNTIYHAIDSKKLNQVTLVSPNDNSLGIPTIPTLTWNTVPNAELYEIQLSDKVDFSYRIEFATQSDTLRVTSTNLKSNTQYYWRVRAKCHSAFGTWSTLRNFTTSIQSPILFSPDDGQKGVTQTYNFQWNPVDGATKYYLVIAKDAKFVNKVFEKDNIKDTFCLVNILKPITNYYWKVQAKTDAVASGFSEVWSFFTVVGTPVMRTPADHSMELNTTVKMTWDTTLLATKYWIQIATDSLFQNMSYEGKTDTKFSHQLTILNYNTKYYWRVRGENNDGVGLYAATWDYTTGIAPAVLVSPENKLYNQDTSVVLRWEPVENKTYYNLQVSTDQSFTNLIVNDSTITDVNYELKNMEFYSDYYWRVRVILDNRKGFWSEVWTYKTQLGKVILTTPANNAIKQDIQLYLRWEPLKGAKYYHLYVSSDEAFVDKTLDKDSIDVPNKDIYKLLLGTKYFWKVIGYNSLGESKMSDVWNFTTTTIESVNEPGNNILSAAVYPNPFSSEATIIYILKNASNIKIAIFNIYGEKLLDNDAIYQEAGEHIFEWAPKDLPIGEYFYRITAGTDVLSGRMVFVK